MATITLGRQTLSTLTDGAQREWLVTDGVGGYAMGSAPLLRTRRYHGLLVVATDPPIGRRLALAAIDPVVVIGDRRVELATHEWAGGAIAPRGCEHLDRFDLIDGVPRWQWSIGSVVLTLEIAATNGSSAVSTKWTMVATGPHEAVRLELMPLCTWRDVHGERHGDGDPAVEPTGDGFVFERAYRVRGPGWQPGGDWYRGVHHREEAARGLAADEDLWSAGRFVAELRAGEWCSVDAWSEPGRDGPAPAPVVIDAARDRVRGLVNRAGATDDADALLVTAADQFVVTTGSGPTVVAGYPWFGDWSRDTMTSYEGLFLETDRAEEGRALLLAAASTVSEGMLANTADAGGTEYNTVDGSLWFLHAAGRHIQRTGDLDLGAELLPVLDDIVEHHVRGTRFGIRVDDDGLVTQGADGWALTWMDARVDGIPITQRRGKPVEVNALWIDGLGVAADLARRSGRDGSRVERLLTTATESFLARFPRPDGHGWFDVVDGPGGDDASVRPNQVVAAALLRRLLSDHQIGSVRRATEALVTPLGLRSLDPAGDGYAGRHRGSAAERDRAYHEGTIWPWLAGSYADLGGSEGAGLETHIHDWGLGSVSETADGDPPHDATGCPFQAWSVAELLRCRGVTICGR